MKKNSEIELKIEVDYNHEPKAPLWDILKDTMIFVEGVLKNQKMLFIENENDDLIIIIKKKNEAAKIGQIWDKRILDIIHKAEEHIKELEVE